MTLSQKMGMGFILAFCVVVFTTATPSTDSNRIVVTFVNSSVAIVLSENIPSNTTKVKQYGRRLVLHFDSWYEQERNKNDVLTFYGGSDYVENIETDFIVRTNIVNAEVNAQDISGFLKHNVESSTSNGTNDIFPWIESSGEFGNEIEWQFAADEPYGMQVEKVWALTNGSTETRISILDTGIAAIAREKDWFASLDEGYDFISDPDYSVDGDGRDSNSEDPGDAGASCPTSSWHGTKMAFAMAGRHDVISGLHSMAWNTTIQPLRVLGLCSIGFANDVTDAIVWASGGLINGLGINPKPSQIISMSFGGRGKCPSYLQSAINLASRQYGVVLIAAAGNDGSDEENFFPANCIGVVNVAASNSRGVLAEYSNRGKSISISAPGGDVLSPIYTFELDVNMTLKIIEGIGTSYAVSFVSGFLALEYDIFSNEPNASIVDMRYVLQRSTRWFNISFNSFTEVMCNVHFMCGSGILSMISIINNPHSFWVDVGIKALYSPYIVAVSPVVKYPITLTWGDFRVYSQATTVCLAGTYFTGTGTITASQCTKCLSGKYSTLIGSDSMDNCTECLVGSYSLEGRSLCSLCPGGTYSFINGTSSCTICSAGQYCTGGGASLSCPIYSTSYQNLSGEICTIDNTATCSKNCENGICPSGDVSLSFGEWWNNVGRGTWTFDRDSPSSSKSIAVRIRFIGMTGGLSGSLQVYYKNNFNAYILLAEYGTSLSNDYWPNQWFYPASTKSVRFVYTKRGSAVGFSADYASVYERGAADVKECNCTDKLKTIITSECVCVPGFYSLSLVNNDPCIRCEKGTFTDTSNSTFCKSCQLGSYNENHSKSTCSLCNAGTYSTVVQSFDQRDCTACGIALYSTTSGASSSSFCTACPIGTYATSTGLSSSILCVLCSPGSYATMQGNTFCLLCSSGSFSTGSGISSSARCSQCPQGAYSTVTGASTCILCPSGQICTGGSSLQSCPVNSTSQQNLNGGEICSIDNALTCSRGCENGVCPSGDFSTWWGYYHCCGSTWTHDRTAPQSAVSMTVRIRSIGGTDSGGSNLKLFYENSIGSMVLIAEFGHRGSTYYPNQLFYTPPTKRVRISYWKSGYAIGYQADYASIYPRGAVTPYECNCTDSKKVVASTPPICLCFPGKMIDQSDNTKCIDCSKGKYSTLINGTLCLDCNPGKYLNSTGANNSGMCLSCDAGKYSTEYGSIGCTKGCEAGYYSKITGATLAQGCKQCQVGTFSEYASSACLLCQVGKYFTGFAATACTLCSVGTYSRQGFSVCRDCPLNSIANTTGNSRCMTIPGYYNLGSSMMCYYPFNKEEFLEDVTMKIGKLIDNYLGPMPQLSAAPGLTDSAFLNQNFGAYFNIPPLTLPVSFTYCTWYYITSPHARNWQRIMDFGNCGGCDNVLYGINGGSNDFSIQNLRGGGGLNNLALVGEVSKLNQWRHTCFATNSTSVSMQAWMDGLPNSRQYMTSGGRNLNVKTVNNYIGRSNWGDQYWHGSFDEIRLFEGYLTDIEIANIYSFKGDSYTDVLPVPCRPGTFASGFGITTCTLCTSGTFASESGASACIACKPGTYGSNMQYGNIAINIGKTCGSGKTSVCPIAASGTCCGWTNDRGMDGNLGTGSHSGGEVPAWWRMDLETTRSIGGGKIWARTDCCQDQFPGVSIWVGNSTTYNGIGNINCWNQTTFEFFLSPFSMFFQCRVIGRYFFLMRNANPLSFMELEIYESYGGSETTCENCPPGKYSVLTNATSYKTCVDCESGKYNMNIGSSYCLTCEEGKYTSSVGSSTCLSCTGSCSVGSYKHCTSATSNVCCTVNTYLNAATSTCTACPVNTFSDGSLKSCLSNCPSGEYKLSANNSCVQCSPGTFGVQGTCLPCEGGQYSFWGATACTLCAYGSYTTGSNEIECDKCVKGTFSSTIGSSHSSVCETCKPGSFSSTEGASTCSTCPLGTNQSMKGNTDLSNCSLCTDQTFNSKRGASECQDCPYPYWVALNSTKCQDNKASFGITTYANVLYKFDLANPGNGLYFKNIGIPNPVGVAISPDGLYVLITSSSSNNESIYKLFLDSKFNYPLKVAGGSPSGYANGYNSKFKDLKHIAISHDGSFALVADSGNNAIRRLNLLSLEVTTIVGADCVEEVGCSSIENKAGLGNSTYLNSPCGIDIHPSGKWALISEVGNKHRIKRVNLKDGMQYFTKDINNGGVAGSTDDSFLASTFNQPWAIAYSFDGNKALVINRGDARIRIMDFRIERVWSLVYHGGTNVLSDIAWSSMNDYALYNFYNNGNIGKHSCFETAGNSYGDLLTGFGVNSLLTMKIWKNREMERGVDVETGSEYSVLCPEQKWNLGGGQCTTCLSGLITENRGQKCSGCPNHQYTAYVNLAKSCGNNKNKYCVATQSSIHSSNTYGPWIANDGAIFDFTITNYDLNAWWRIDLEMTKEVTGGKIWNRNDGGSLERLDRYNVWIGGNGSSYNGTGNELCFVSTRYQHRIHPFITSFTCLGSGRYVYVQIPTTNHLQLSEVEIYGPSQCMPCPNNMKNTPGAPFCYVSRTKQFRLDHRNGHLQFGPDGTIPYNTNMDSDIGTLEISDGTLSISGYVIPRGFQVWTVGKTATYTFVAGGGSGGNDATFLSGAGYGAVVTTHANLTQGDTILILVGQEGGYSWGCGSGGGGGTFISKYSPVGPVSDFTKHALILVAGGGGGEASGTYYPFIGRNANFGTSGQNYNAGGGYVATGGGGGGGGAGNGGLNGADGTRNNINHGTSGGGGGFKGNGGHGRIEAAGQNTFGGKSFVNGGAGGYSSCQSPTYYPNPSGGFGGGGGAWNGGGGGGGYSGGQGPPENQRWGGGGGGSFDHRRSASQYQDGLRFFVYSGYFSDNVNWFTSTSAISGTTTMISSVTTGTQSIKRENTEDYYSIQWLGYFRPRMNGSWTFYTNSDEASYLWIGDNAVSGRTTGNALINNGGGHGMQVRTGSIYLTENTYYPMRIQYGDGGGGDNCQVYFNVPGSSTAIFDGKGYFFHDVWNNIDLSPSSNAAIPYITWNAEAFGSPAPETYEDGGLNMGNGFVGIAICDSLGSFISLETNECLLCPPGKYFVSKFANSEKDACILCSENTYSNERGSTTCRRCSSGYSSKPGSAQCSVCSKYLNENPEIILQGILGPTTDVDGYLIYSFLNVSESRNIWVTRNVEVDLLIVGGGGSGGFNVGGGGGAGTVLFAKNFTLEVNKSYIFQVGQGGPQQIGSSNTGNSGSASSIYEGTTPLFVAVGGGGGGGQTVAAASGGSGGGGGASCSSRSSVGVASSTNVYFSVNGIRNGSSGGLGFQNGNCQYAAGGGGGGAGLAGFEANVSFPGFGGDGIYRAVIGFGEAHEFSGVFGEAYNSIATNQMGKYYIAGGGGGGGNNGNSQCNIPGGVGGGGYGNKCASNGASSSGSPNTGGGGGGGGANSGMNLYGGAGGSGLILLRHRSNFTYAKSGGRLYTDLEGRHVMLFDSGNRTISFSDDTYADVLLVGGGGSGGNDRGGGGGSGQVIFKSSFLFESNQVYKIIVGTGGQETYNYVYAPLNSLPGSDGNASGIRLLISDIELMTAMGGGGGGGFDASCPTFKSKGRSGASGGGAAACSHIQLNNDGGESFLGLTGGGGTFSTVNADQWKGGGGAGSSVAGLTGTFFSGGNGGVGIHEVLINETYMELIDVFGNAFKNIADYQSGTYYIGGGGGGGGQQGSSCTYSRGGMGGGGKGFNCYGSVFNWASSALPNTGSGGGGGAVAGNSQFGKSGAAGIALIQYSPYCKRSVLELRKEICNAGSFLMEDTCFPCNGGTFNVVQNATSCISCPVNYFCSSGVSSPVACIFCDQIYTRKCDREGQMYDSSCACNSGFYLANPTAEIKCAACPPYTTSAANNTETTILGCHCLPGYYCTYSKRIKVTLQLNMSISDFNVNVQASLIQTLAQVAGVSTDKVQIISTVSKSGRQLLSTALMEVTVAMHGMEHLKKTRVHFHPSPWLRSKTGAFTQVHALDLNWRPDHEIHVSKI